MRLHIAVFIAMLIAPLCANAQGNLGTYEDRIAVEDVMARYVWAVDSLDPEGYVAVFTEDAVIDSNGSISKGHEEIRKIVTSLIKRRDDNKAKGLPASNLRASTGSPRNCSGAMYGSVPATVCVSVRVTVNVASLTGRNSFASPKSNTFTWPRAVTKMLVGLMS